MKNLIALLLLTMLLGCNKTPPRILIIGDSISIGYTPFVKELLGEKAEVFHNEGNAQHTGTGLEKVAEWIGDQDWDIIQFNWGLWDLAYRHEDSKVQGKRDKINGTVTFTPDQYQANMDSLLVIIKSVTKAKLLFVSTSYVPEGEAGRYSEDAQIYNSRAFKVMEKHKVAINDIYETSREIHSEHATAPDNVHFTPEGYKLLAVKIAEGLKKNCRKLK